MLILALEIVSRIVLTVLTSTRPLGQQVSQSTGLGGHNTVLSLDDGRGAARGLAGRCLAGGDRRVASRVAALHRGLAGGGAAGLPFVLSLGREAGRGRTVGANATSGAVRHGGRL